MNLVSIKHNTEFSGFDIAMRAFVILSFIAASALLLYVPVSDLSLTSCAFKDFTGHSCPTCGLTRSLHHLLNFNLIDSLYYHPMGIVLFGGMLIISVKYGYELYSGKVIAINKNYVSLKIIFLSIAIFWVMFWIIRMITE